MNKLSQGSAQTRVEVGQVLYTDHLWFPHDAVLGLSCHGAVGTLVGNEGGVAKDQEAVCVVGGMCYTTDLTTLSEQQAIIRYRSDAFGDAPRMAYCATHHGITSRVAGFVAALVLRTGSSTLHMTQEQLASMLGVRRQSVNTSFSEMLRAGVLHKDSERSLQVPRGRIVIYNLDDLRIVGCDCFIR